MELIVRQAEHREEIMIKPLSPSIRIPTDHPANQSGFFGQTYRSSASISLSNAIDSQVHVIMKEQHSTLKTSKTSDSSENNNNNNRLSAFTLNHNEFCKPSDQSPSVSNNSPSPQLLTNPSVSPLVNLLQSPIASTPSSPPDDSMWAVASPSDPPPGTDSSAGGRMVVVAIDFGTTFSGYAFSFVRDTARSVYVMRKWEGGDAGLMNQKTPTVLLLTPTGEFHSFGFTARDFYHDLSDEDARKWLYFDKFKMALHYTADLNSESTVVASNGQSYPALKVFAHSLRFFKDHVLTELHDQSGTIVLADDLRWVITVPAIWKEPAKQFMRRAAYLAGIASENSSDQLLIALEPEAASIYVRRLRLYQLLPETPLQSPPNEISTGSNRSTSRPQSGTVSTSSQRRSVVGGTEPGSPRRLSFIGTESTSFSTFGRTSQLFDDDVFSYNTMPTRSDRKSVRPSSGNPLTSDPATVGEEVNVEGTVYMIVDCGGGTVDITVHEMDSSSKGLIERYKATGGPHGSTGVDVDFERLLVDIFGGDFIKAFKSKRPAGWVDLMIAFESRKRAASPLKAAPLNVSLPFSFIDLYKKRTSSTVEAAIRKHGNLDVRWSAQGMLRLQPEAMQALFSNTLAGIRQAIGNVLNEPNVRDVKYMFVVGGFAESPLLQASLRREFGHILRVLIPQEVGLVILKGAVLYGLDPKVIVERRSRLTYGMGVLNRFDPVKHPRSKLIHKDGVDWCIDVFDKIVLTDQSILLGATMERSYTPAKSGQRSIVMHIYSSERRDAVYVTDTGVKHCGTLRLELDEDVGHPTDSSAPLVGAGVGSRGRRLIQTRMTFSETEIRVSALDIATGKIVKATIDFLNK